MSKPKLSVVIGSHNASNSIAECLNSLERQQNDQEVEIVVVDNSTDGTSEILKKQFPHIKVVRESETSFIPQLWETGINRSNGEIVALTTAHCVPNMNWVEEILKAHRLSFPGIGGAIENDEGAELVQWAIYFCRYSPYMLPLTSETVKEIPGDNASYQRLALDRCKQVRRNGFWEPLVHAELRKGGGQLLMTPSIVVSHRKSFSFSEFISQRFWHGRQFGSGRASQISLVKRLLYLLFSPLIPLIFLARIGRQVLSKKRHVGKFLLSLPILITFLLSWATGECSGYLRPSV